MAALQRKVFDEKQKLFGQSAVFFVLFYLYIWLYIEPQLIYHGSGSIVHFPVFFTGWPFFKDFLAYPGGIVEYAGSALSQYYYYSWTGALIITLTALGLYWCTYRLIFLATGIRSKIIAYVPALFVATMYSRYDHTLITCLALLSTLWFLVIYEQIFRGKGTGRTVWFVILFLLLYYVAGGASLVFAALAGVYEIFTRRAVLIGVLYFLLGLIVPWLVGGYIFELGMADVYLGLLPFHPEMELLIKGYAQGLYIFVYLAVPIMTLWYHLVRSRVSPVRVKKSQAKSKSSGRKKMGTFLQSDKGKWAVQLGLLAVISVLSVCLSFYGRKKKVLQMMYFSRQKMWPQVLEVARRMPDKFYDIYCNHSVNLALYHLGQLGDEMFSFPQSPYALLLSVREKNLRMFMMTGDAAMELGDLNLAEKMYYEIMENQGTSPLILYKLALINIAKRQMESAKILLNALSKDLIHGSRAKKMLRQLDTDPQLSWDEQVQLLRSVMYKKETVSWKSALLDDFLLQLLKQNRHNRMAFEYLMAYYLLVGRVDKIAENIYRLDDFGYKTIPRHYEEAIVLYMNTTRKTVDLRGRAISRQTVERARTFSEVYRRFGNNVQAARDALDVKFGDSYFFYFVFSIPRKQ